MITKQIEENLPENWQDLTNLSSDLARISPILVSASHIKFYISGHLLSFVNNGLNVGVYMNGEFFANMHYSRAWMFIKVLKGE